MRAMMIACAFTLLFLTLGCSGGSGMADGDTPDGDTPDGDTPDGDTPDGDTPDGDTPDGDTPDGDTPDGDDPDGDDPDGDDPDGDEDGDEDGDTDCTCFVTDTCCDGCLPRNEDGACDDGQVCTVNTTCTDGVCGGGEENTCDDDNPCTTDYCTNDSCYNDWLIGCEVCNDYTDNNGNGWVDCDDPYCQDAPECAEIPLGDSCGKPFLVNDGEPIGQAHNGQLFSYTGNTTSLNPRYEGYCPFMPEVAVQDAVYKIVLDVPMVLSVSHDFDGAGDDSPWSVLYVFSDVCHPAYFMDCEWGETGAATMARTFPAGTYYFVVDGVTDAENEGSHAGPYTFTVDVSNPPANETDCSNGIDDDGDGLTDCMDPDCYSEDVCEVCPVKADLQCGATHYGTFLDASEIHYYTFKTPTAMPISVTITKPQGATDNFNINFKEGPVTLGCDNLYSVGGVTIWSTTNPYARGFTTTANKDYVVRLHAQSFHQGQYTLSYQCGTDPESNCSDEIDNDVDGLTDCEDPDCFADVVCSGGYSGNTCGEAFRVNGGTAVGLADVQESGLSFTHINTTLNKTNNHQAACLTASKHGPDAVYRFTLTDTLAVGVVVEFLDFLQRPGVYLFSGTCDSGGLVGCGESMFWLAYTHQTLPPGTYYLVVDSGTIGSDGIPDASHYEIEFYFEVPPEEE